ncbi:PilZ domain-containing protein [Ketobacter sp. MCCC 1A13808]|uniref:PilZ domain-containing protein n=1 Tax=Ketobacter sp. MCCC 1A13808 TaxID=2602738 RepID=UPI000F27B8D4|nr:PilZ domain-containing protein [Ketobacter sp. MCCC 1A13808]MVF10518.1 PilZ domain-containing protein [Ketobacter sp. MCCC 1A13808]RLP55948.1 MAG: PilZ domain-containing protein [Ketobacter sp.]
MAANSEVVDDNQRSVPRRHLIYYLRVFNAESGGLIGNLVDISTKGIMVVSDRKLESGLLFRLRMVLPDTVEGSKEVEFDAETRWCRSDANSDFYDTGLELIDPTNEFLDAVDRLVEDCLFKE